MFDIEFPEDEELDDGESDASSNSTGMPETIGERSNSAERAELGGNSAEPNWSPGSRDDEEVDDSAESSSILTDSVSLSDNFSDFSVSTGRTGGAGRHTRDNRKILGKLFTCKGSSMPATTII